MLRSDEARAIREAFENHSRPVSLEEVRTRLEDEQPSRRAPRLPHRHTGPAVAAAAFVVVVAIGGGLIAIAQLSGTVQRTDTEVPAVTGLRSTTAAPPPTASAPPPGLSYRTEAYELLDEPHVIHAVPSGPVPTFDTSTLGEEAPLVPLSTLTADQLALEESEFPLAPDVPIVALGQRDALLAFRVTVVAFGTPHVCDWGVAWSEGTGQPGGKSIPLGACAFDQQPRPDITVLERALDPTVSQIFWSSLPDETSVVQLTTDQGVMQWQRPVGGVAVFMIETENRPVLELVAYSSTGDVIRRATAPAPQRFPGAEQPAVPTSEP